MYAGRYNLTVPLTNTDPTSIDAATVTFLSELARRSRLNLPSFVRLVRGQNAHDPRPNKTLYELAEPADPTYHDAYRRWNAIVRGGVQPLWTSTRPSRQPRRQNNHRIDANTIEKVRRHIAKGQTEGRYLILDEAMLETWPEVFISPIGTVGKGEEGIRVTNDYAYPRGSSVNDFTDRDNFPRISYNPPRDIARRIHDLRTEHPPVEVLLLLGDVSGAFRHIPINENSVHMFAFLFEDYVVSDLSCGFGWCGSPAFYALAGSVINHLYESSRPEGGAPLDREPFIGNVWCDDHTCVEKNVGTRCKDAEVALRRSMVTVLGPNAINEEKFTSWQTTGKALGLLRDTVNGTVSIPTEKLLKAQLRVHTLLQTGYASKSDLNKLLGNLRQGLAACFPAARSFYQRLHASAVGMHPGSKRQLNEDDRDDLFWFRAVLLNGDRFNKIPVVQFAGIATPTVHIFMDASDTGLCALEPTRLEYIRVKFTDAQKLDLRKEPRVNSINVRELQSAVLAALYWGQYWKQDAEIGPTYVCFHIDNSSTVAWANRRSARNPAPQLFNRLLSLAELQYRVVFTAEHVPGIDNIMADAGSRAWSSTDKLWSLWTN